MYSCAVHSSQGPPCIYCGRVNLVAGWPIKPRRGIGEFRHSPSNLAESEGRSEVFGLGAWQSLCERVGDHVFGRTVINDNLPGFYYVSDEVEANVDVLGARVELFVSSEGDGGLRIGVKRHRSLGLVDFGNKFTKPDGLFRSVSSGDVLGFSG